VLYATSCELTKDHTQLIIGAVNSTTPSQPLNFQAMFPSLLALQVHRGKIQLLATIDFKELGGAKLITRVDRLAKEDIFLAVSKTKIVMVLFRDGKFEKMRFLDIFENFEGEMMFSTAVVGLRWYGYSKKFKCLKMKNFEDHDFCLVRIFG
jgi:hypothetical protein